jgi:hypothetical protein
MPSKSSTTMPLAEATIGVANAAATASPRIVFFTLIPFDYEH